MGIRSHRDLLVSFLWALATLAAVCLSSSLLLRTVLGAPMVFFVSGHATLRAIGIKTTSLSEHLAYAVGTSLAVGIAGGFVLNAAGFLTPLGWAVWFCAITLGATLVADNRSGAPDLPPWPGSVQIRFWQGAAIAVAVLLATGAYALAARDDATYRQFSYTAFWILPSTGGGPGRITVGVRSAETKTQRFDVEISLDGRLFAVFQSLTIAPGETWLRQLPVPVAETSQKAEARLYRPDDNRLYRSVSTLVPRR
ncbi:hypothetical protein RAD15_21855 [Bradyrhizobium sp. 14AA]